MSRNHYDFLSKGETYLSIATISPPRMSPNHCVRSVKPRTHLSVSSICSPEMFPNHSVRSVKRKTYLSISSIGETTSCAPPRDRPETSPVKEAVIKELTSPGTRRQNPFRSSNDHRYKSPLALILQIGQKQVRPMKRSLKN